MTSVSIQIHGSQPASAQCLAIALGQVAFFQGAAAAGVPNDGIRESFSHSSYPTRTASRRPRRVKTQGSPRTASSTTAERVALASPQLNFLQCDRGCRHWQVGPSFSIYDASLVRPPRRYRQRLSLPGTAEFMCSASAGCRLREIEPRPALL